MEENYMSILLFWPFTTHAIEKSVNFYSVTLVFKTVASMENMRSKEKPSRRFAV